VTLVQSPPLHGAADPVVIVPAPRSNVAIDQRLASLDFAKGVLVLVMVLYHWLNYFIGLQWDGYRYLRFLTPAFICISGFLVSRVYLQRYSADDPRLRRRLLGRGLKLLALFLALNILIDWTLGGGRVFNLSRPAMALSWAEAIFVQGRGGFAAFEILVSIAYFLLLAPLVLLVSKRLAIPLWVIAAIAITAAAVVSNMRSLNPHLEILPLAFLGLAAGANTSSRLASPLSSPVLVLLAYPFYLAAVAMWNVSYPLLVVAVTLNLLLIHVSTLLWGTSGAIQQYVVRIGQYSLLSYIVQIAVLQLLRRALQGQYLGVPALIGSLAVALAVTVAVVELTVLLRSRSTGFDRLYRVIFA